MTTTAAVRTTPSADDERRQLATVRADLLREFGDRVSEQEIDLRFAETVHRFDDAPIRSFVPVLARRDLRERLRRTLA